MQYTICGFQQTELVKFGLDCVDTVLLRYIRDFFDTMKMAYKIIDNKIYVWVNYDYVLRELPILNIEEAQSLGRRFSKWEEKKLITKLITKGKDECVIGDKKITRYGTFTYICFNSDNIVTLLAGRLAGAGSKSPTPPKKNEGLDAEAQPGSDQKSDTAGTESPTKDPSSYPSPRYPSTSCAYGEVQIYFKWCEWEFRSDGKVYSPITKKIYPVREFPGPLPIEICQKIDEVYGHP